MIEIRTGGEVLDLPKGFSMEIEDSNPILNERGSQSLPATVPATRRNVRLLHAVHRIDSAFNPNFPEQKAVVSSGGFIRGGVLNVTEAGRNEGITFNVGFDNSTAYTEWSARKLSELRNLPVFVPAEAPSGTPVDLVLDELYRIYKAPRPRIDDFAVFPVALGKETNGSGASEKTYWEVLNAIGDHGLSQPGSVRRVLDGKVTDVTVPEAYCVSPFLRVWRVLELIFVDLGLRIINNPFKVDSELTRLVVLNNAADVCCVGKINYAELMPDCTVEEFMNALWVRFGLVYNINYHEATVSLQFLRDIIHKVPFQDLTPSAVDFEKIAYSGRQYIKLSAKTSVEGAAPATERFEDFYKGLDISAVRLGRDVSSWQNRGTTTDPHWDGDVQDEWDEGEEPDVPDPDIPEPEDPEPYSMRVPATAAPSAATSGSDSGKNTTFLAREFVSANWYRLDASNSTTKESSTSFFNWDPQPEGIDALELTSDDEWVPVGRVANAGTHTGNIINEYCPLYLVGARHYHSYIRGNDGKEENGDTTPLAFMLAYTVEQKSFGRFCPEGDDGAIIKDDDGSKPTLSLLFQFRDGLFERFWKGYDEIVRHSGRSVEVKTRINKIELHNLDLLNTVRFKGVKCLVDTATYSLPAGRLVPVDMKLFPLQTQGDYDIKAEQNVPEFSIANRHLEWYLVADGLSAELDTQDVRGMAADLYVDSTDYAPHTVDDVLWKIDWRGISLKSFSRLHPYWTEDTRIQEPTVYRQEITMHYNARFLYDVYELTETDVAPYYQLAETPIGQIPVDVDYTIKLRAKWVND